MQTVSATAHDRLSISQKVGINMKLVRESKALTLEEAARLIHVCKSTLWRMENGERLLRVDDVYEFANAIGCQVKDLLP